MKKLISLIKINGIILLIFFPLITAGCSYTESQNTMDQTAPDGYNLDELNNYGEWVHIDNYGDAWRPYVVSDWMPFDNGYWAYADGSWTWISYEPFGWIVYHYGYWYDDSFYGWVWIPSDNQWSPARVEWVDYDNYIGWAPLPPPGIVYSQPWERRENNYWQVVRKKDFDKEDIWNYRVENPVRNEMGGRGVSNEPPDRSRIEASTGSRINEVKIQREDVGVKKREIMRMNLPPGEVKKVEKTLRRSGKKFLFPVTNIANINAKKSSRENSGDFIKSCCI